eukprot:gene1665-33061_t
MNAARLFGSKAVSAGAAIAASGVGSTVQARAPVPQAAQASTVNVPSQKLSDDGWMMLEMEGEQKLFQMYTPAEVDVAAQDVLALLSNNNSSSHSALTCDSESTDSSEGTEADTIIFNTYTASPDVQHHIWGCSHSALTCDSESTDSSEGTEADAIISSAYTANPDVQHRTQDIQLSSLLSVTTRMLNAPGLQAQVVQFMLEDDEVRQLILGLEGNQNLDAYLSSKGLSAPSLLPPFGAGPPQVQIQELDSEEGGPNPLAALINNIVHGVAWASEQAGSRLARLGDWLRSRFAQQVTREGKQGAADRAGGPEPWVPSGALVVQTDVWKRACIIKACVRAVQLGTSSTAGYSDIILMYVVQTDVWQRACIIKACVLAVQPGTSSTAGYSEIILMYAVQTDVWNGACIIKACVLAVQPATSSTAGY